MFRTFLVSCLIVCFGATTAFEKADSLTTISQFEICSQNSSAFSNITSYDLNGVLTSPNYQSGYYYQAANCYFYIHAPVGYAIQITVTSFAYYNGANYVYLELATSSNSINYSRYALLPGSGYTNTNYNLGNNGRIHFYVTGICCYGWFSLSWKLTPNFSTLPPKSCQEPNVLFLLDRSQAIYSNYYNQVIKNFVRNMTGQFSFSDDVDETDPFLSNFGVIEFSDTPTVSIPLKLYSRLDFLWSLQENVSYGNGGDSNVTAALLLAYDEILNASVSHSPTIVILIVNDISPFGYNQTIRAMETLKQVANFSNGIIVPGLPGIPTGAQQRLGNLTDYTFASLDDAVMKIPALSNSTFQCSVCKNLIFICEMTVAIGYQEKLQCLQLAQRLASLSPSKNQRFAIATYGVQIYNGIELQTFYDFNNTINKMIENVEQNNLPNGGQTYLAPILNQLYKIISNDPLSLKYAVLITGELTAIRDPSPANIAAQNISSLNANVYVLDQTSFGSSISIWSTLTKNQAGHIVLGKNVTDIENQFAKFNGTLLREFANIPC